MTATPHPVQADLEAAAADMRAIAEMNAKQKDHALQQVMATRRELARVQAELSRQTRIWHEATDRHREACAVADEAAARAAGASAPGATEGQASR